MRRLPAALALLLLAWIGGDAQPQRNGAPKNFSAQSGFPAVVRVRLWYLHPPQEMKLQADAGQAKVRKCTSCGDGALGTLTLRAAGSRRKTVSICSRMVENI